MNEASDRTGVIEILKALSVHGSEGRTELRDQIIDIYGELLMRQPDLAGYVAKDISKWGATKFASLMAEILTTTELDEPSELAVVGYLSSIKTKEVDTALQTFYARRGKATY